MIWDVQSRCGFTVASQCWQGGASSSAQIVVGNQSPFQDYLGCIVPPHAFLLIHGIPWSNQSCWVINVWPTLAFSRLKSLKTRRRNLISPPVPPWKYRFSDFQSQNLSLEFCITNSRLSVFRQIKGVHANNTTSHWFYRYFWDINHHSMYVLSYSRTIHVLH